MDTEKVVVVSDDRYGRGRDDRRDDCCTSEKIKDAISRSDIANANYAHNQSDDTGTLKTSICEARADVKNAVSDVSRQVCESTSGVIRAVDASAAATQVGQKLLGYDLSMQACNFGAAAALASAQNTAALQAAIAAANKETALAFKDSELNRREEHCALSKQLSECCCSIKQELADVKFTMVDSLKQQQIDSLNRDNAELKMEALVSKCCKGRRGSRSGS